MVADTECELQEHLDLELLLVRQESYDHEYNENFEVMESLSLNGDMISLQFGHNSPGNSPGKTVVSEQMIQMEMKGNVKAAVDSFDTNLSQ
eukprot:14798255-Ditylum_brightwellii.AAC.1